MSSDATPGRDEPGAIPGDGTGARGQTVAVLVEQLRALAEAGDLEAARVVHDAIGRLLGATGNAASVVDLSAARERKK